jgi:tryptophan halogenase
MQRALGDLKGNIASAVARMPTHQAFLDQYCTP